MPTHCGVWLSLIGPTTVSMSTFSGGRMGEGLQLHIARLGRSRPGPNRCDVWYQPETIDRALVDEVCATWLRSARFAAWTIEDAGQARQAPWPPQKPGVLVRFRWRGGMDGGQIELLLPGRMGAIAGTDTASMLKLGGDVVAVVGPTLIPRAKVANRWRGWGVAWEIAGLFLDSSRPRTGVPPWRYEHTAVLPDICHVVYFSRGEERAIVVVDWEGAAPVVIPPGHVLDLAPGGVGPFVMSA